MSFDLHLNGLRAVVTGGTLGLGAAVVKTLAEAGARVAALAEYHIKDTPAEAHFDDLVRLASYICKAPIALMSLLDADRQWFKARVGLDTTETPIAYSFCSRTVAEKNMLIVTDTHEDARFRANPLVTGAPYIRFYAGAPLINPAGVALGSLCVIDREPHELDARQREALVALAGQAIAQLELRRVNRDLAQALQSKWNRCVAHRGDERLGNRD